MSDSDRPITLRGASPQKYPQKYDPNYHPESYIELCKEGKTRAQISAVWGICRETLVAWSKDETTPEMVNAVKIGDDLREAWWTTYGLELVQKEKINPSIYIWLTKNILKWHDKERPQEDDEQKKKLTLSYTIEKEV